MMGRNLTSLAEQGGLPPIQNREKEIQQLVDSLSSRIRNNSLLVGNPGVGKSAIVEGLAIRLAREDAPPGLKNLKLIRLNAVDLAAGIPPNGNLEEAIWDLLQETLLDPRWVLFIDNFPLGEQQSSSSPGLLDFCSTLRKAMETEGFTCVVAARNDDPAKFLSRLQGGPRKFQELHVYEPGFEITRDICRETIYQAGVSRDILAPAVTLAHAVNLTNQYVRGFSQPGKAIDILEHAAVLTVQSLPASPGADCAIEVPHVRRVLKEYYRAHIHELFSPSGRQCMDDLEIALVDQPEALYPLKAFVHRTVNTERVWRFLFFCSGGPMVNSLRGWRKWQPSAYVLRSRPRYLSWIWSSSTGMMELPACLVRQGRGEVS